MQFIPVQPRIWTFSTNSLPKMSKAWMTECLIDCSVGGGGRFVLNSCFHKKRKSFDSHVCNFTDQKSFHWDAVPSIVFHPVLATPLLKTSFSSHCIQKKKEKEYCILYFGWFSAVWILCVDVSEHCLFHLHRWCKQEEWNQLWNQERWKKHATKI